MHAESAFRFRKYAKYITVFFIIAFIIVLNSVRVEPGQYDFSILYKLNLNFWGIFIQAFPFLIAGSFFSSMIQFFAGQNRLNILLNKTGVVSYILPLAASFILPSCDCSSVTLAAGFIKKKIPLKPVIIYLLAAPILNPVAIISTLFAFPGKPQIALLRVIFGILTAVVAGSILYKVFENPDSYVSEKYSSGNHNCSAGHHHEHHKEGRNVKLGSIFSRIRLLLLNTGDELFHVLPFVVIGAMVSAIFQAVVPKDMLAGNPDTGIYFQSAVMLFAAFMLSVCSTSDAFIAKAFTSHFATGPVIGFMIFGPMIDVKSIIVLSSYFKKRFVVILSLLTFVIAYISTIFISFSLAGVL